MSSPTFCLLPWLSMAVRNNGNYRVCCHANTSEGRGMMKDEANQNLNAATVSLAEARNSEHMKNLRLKMLEGQWPDSCARCQREETAGIRSKRIYSKDTLPDQYNEEWARTVTESDGSLQLLNAPLVDLDVRFGNKCNLACRMCSPSDSSAWAADYKKLWGKVNEERFDWYEQESFWQSLEKDAEKLEHIYIVGGEPLLIDRHYIFLQHLVDQGKAAKITLEYNTNLTILPPKVLDLWKNFAKVRLGVSFDGVLAINDYIRYPSKFSVIEKNLHKIDQAEGNYQVWLACTISTYNIHHLVDFMRWVKAQNFSRINQTVGKEFFVPHPVHRPLYLNIQAFPEQMKQMYKAHLQTELQKFLSEDLSADEKKRAQQIVDMYVNFMEARDLEQYWPEFISYTKRLDEIRQQDYRSLNALYNLD